MILTCLIVALVYLTGSRANLMAVGGFVGTFAILSRRRLWIRTTLLLGVACCILLALSFIANAPAKSRWGQANRITHETMALLNGGPLERAPLGRATITAASLNTIAQHWEVGAGPRAHEYAVNWAERNGLRVLVLMKNGRQYFTIHGSLMIRAAQTGVVATGAFVVGLLGLGWWCYRRYGFQGAALPIATLVLIALSQIGADTLGKVFCWIVLGVSMAACERDRTTLTKCRISISDP